MLNLVKYVTIVVILGSFDARVLATHKDPFLTDINQLSVFAQNNPMDLTSFELKWGENLARLQMHSLSDVNKEQQLELRMKSLVKLLCFNFNRTGIELVKKYAPLSCQLALARAYFEEGYPFNASNRPTQENMALIESATLYLGIMARTQQLMLSCCQELNGVINAGGKLNDLRFQHLSYSIREERVRAIGEIISDITETPNHLIGSFKLLNLRASSIQIIEEDLRYSLDFFLDVDKKNFAWCAHYVLGQKNLSKQLYAYEKTKQALEQKTALVDFIEWFREARSLESLKGVRT